MISRLTRSGRCQGREYRTKYIYDAIGQLTFGDSATASEDRRYVYDAAWNLNYRTTPTADGPVWKELTLTVAAGAIGRKDATRRLRKLLLKQS